MFRSSTVKAKGYQSKRQLPLPVRLASLHNQITVLFIQLFCHSASHAVNVQTSQSLGQPFVFRKCEKKSTSNVKSNVFLTYHAVNQVDRSQRLKRSMILWRQKSVVVEGWGVDHLPTRKLRHQSIRHWMLFLLVSRSLMEFDKNVVAKWLVANLRGSEMTKKRMNAV